MSALVIAAIAFSFSVGMRYQLVFFPLTLGMYLLWKRKWSGALLFGIFFTLGFALTQIDNLLFWHKPIYQHLLDYQSYNTSHFADYPSNVFSYLALITYYIFPVVTIVFLISLRRRPSHEVPSSERPSSTGPSHIVHEAMRWSIYLSIIYTVSYSFYIPKSKYLEASKALYERGDFQNVVIDNWKGEESVWLPMHYVGKFVHPFSMTNKKSLDQLKQQITHQPFFDSKRLPAPSPNYLILWGKEESHLRAKAYEESGFQLQRLSPAQSEKENGFALYSLDFLP